jgi:protein-S-isoprenylcysteine O-methyltransferase Ste14
MGRYVTLVVAVACYAAFFAAFLYLIGFAAAFDGLPTHVDRGRIAGTGAALIIDIGLIALFGLQHSIMARPGFKAAWTRTIPAPLERSVYCLASALALVALFAFWAPLSGSLWSIENETGRLVMWALFLAGWGIVLVATFLINHFALFGLKQAWDHYKGVTPVEDQFRTPLFYRWVRHPIYSGFLLAFWATPYMSYSHLLLALGFTVYIFVGIAHEERDLVAHHGETYLDYRKRVGMVFPGVRRKT